MTKVFIKKEHGLIAISSFNSYYSTKNIKLLFSWACENFNDFHVFLMDESSIFNLMAIGYDEHQAIKKTKKQDRNLKNKVIKSLEDLGLNTDKKIILLSQLSKNDRYIKVYKYYINIFETNIDFKNDCLEATKAMLSGKIQNVNDDAIFLAVKYILDEPPLWFEIPYILNIQSSVLVYNNLSVYWKRICYDYKFLSPQQEIWIKDVLIDK